VKYKKESYLIILLPILIYLTIIIGLIYLSNKVFKSNRTKKTARRSIGIPAIILFPILLLYYFSVLFNIALEDHNNIKKGTFLWYVTMDDKTITEFPIIKQIGEVQYNSLGGDSPSISAGWEIEYLSSINYENSTNKIIPYLNLKGYQLHQTKEPIYTYNIDKNSPTIIYKGRNKEGKTIELIIQELDKKKVKVKCTIVI